MATRMNELKDSIGHLMSENERLREAAALALQALLWRQGSPMDSDPEHQAVAAIDALRSLGLKPLYYRRLEGSQT